MTTKQEESILKSLQSLISKVSRYDERVDHTMYLQIKAEQERLNKILNTLVQCDTE